MTVTSTIRSLLTSQISLMRRLQNLQQLMDMMQNASANITYELGTILATIAQVDLASEYSIKYAVADLKKLADSLMDLAMRDFASVQASILSAVLDTNKNSDLIVNNILSMLDSIAITLVTDPKFLNTQIEQIKQGMLTEKNKNLLHAGQSKVAILQKLQSITDKMNENADRLMDPNADFMTVLKQTWTNGTTRSVTLVTMILCMSVGAVIGFVLIRSAAP